MTCPLCGSGFAKPLSVFEGRTYRACRTCGLAFMEARHHLDAESEAARYRKHRNDPADPKYRMFLNRLASPLSERLKPGSKGLDFGSGPGPTLSVMLGEQGFLTEIYDPFFAPDESVLNRSYDFITCTETAEHFREPGREFARLESLLKPGGWLGIMTERLESDDQFPDWYYIRDPTHVCFYRWKTMDWLAKTHGWTAEYPSKTVTLFHRSGPY
jgi:SAM-dependent methyltransferase